jgi:gamma-glutamyl hydrolase
MLAIRHRTSKRHRSVCVGIMTIPHSLKVGWGQSHIMKAYVDWFEERGVRVIPIPYDTAECEEYFKMVNGILIPGGETDFIMGNSEFIKTATRFFELSLGAKEYFPIWGTCFGYELLITIISGNKRFKKYPAQSLAPIKITETGWRSKMFGGFSHKYLKYLEDKNSTAQNHDFGISPTDFEANADLRRFYNVLATAVDENGREYVAAIEGKYYPIYGVQWHPERQKTGGPFADFFISELRKNTHRGCHIKAKASESIYSATAKRCIQYPEHKKLLCYFFE